MNSARKAALVTGVLFVITIVASIPAQFVFYGPVLNDPNYIVGAGADLGISWGAFLEVLTALAGIGTAVVLFPILKRQEEAVALGYVTVRVVEGVIIMVGIISLLSIGILRQGFAGAAGADASSLVLAGRLLVAFRDQTFLLGPGLLAGFGNGVLLGYLMYRSGLVPRGMVWLGLIGGPLVTGSGLAVLFGLYEQVSPFSVFAALPETVWETSLGLYLIFKGFRLSPITDTGAAR